MFDNILFLFLIIIVIILIVLVILDIFSKKYVIKKLRETNKALYNELIDIKGE